MSQKYFASPFGSSSPPPITPVFQAVLTPKIWSIYDLGSLVYQYFTTNTKVKKITWLTTSDQSRFDHAVNIFSETDLKSAKDMAIQAIINILEIEKFADEKMLQSIEIVYAVIPSTYVAGCIFFSYSILQHL